MKNISAIILLFFCFATQSQSIVSWTEQNGTLGLGYPVPIPVDTTEPFDGFRTYNGLHAKHQSMAMNNASITGHIVGQTHYDRDIWAYVLSDENDLTRYGVKEGAMFINGGVHAREWQSPEVLTGIMELLNENSQDQSLHQYLLENTAIVAIPVNNIDGFLQTQRYPSQNWYPISAWPRDGRMRRKNMLDVDEVLETQSDSLFGVDLNRNNDPYWATSSGSSANVESMVYHGSFSQSEPETQARLNAINLIDAEHLRVYTDVHSFGTVHFSVLTDNLIRNELQFYMLRNFSRFHNAFPGSVYYQDSPRAVGVGIGVTTEYFAETYQVPSWTLEIEPRNGGVEYGGLGINGHDGFILPEAEITRVREQLAQSFMVAWYEQAGPPSIVNVKVVDKDSNAVVYEMGVDVWNGTSRQVFVNQVDNLISSKEYSMILGFDKPMRVRDENNQVICLPGQGGCLLNPLVNESSELDLGAYTNTRWINEKNDDVYSYLNYKDDTFAFDFVVPEREFGQVSLLSFTVDTEDMVGHILDSDLHNATYWENGQWQNHETTLNELFDVAVFNSSKNTYKPLIQPTGLYYDPDRSGEGFSYELLGADGVWLQWFTYDDQGNQSWYSGTGKYSANRIIINDLKQASGGVFGEGFNAENIETTAFGSIEIIFNGGELRDPSIGLMLGTHEVERSATVLFTDVDGKKLRTNLQQLTFVRGAINDIDILMLPVVFNEPASVVSGSWYDATRSGEGYIIEILENGTAILLWYTYDLDGNLMWLFDFAGIITQDGNNITLDFNNVKVTNGGVFGEQFNPDDVNRIPWGEVQFQLNCSGNSDGSSNGTVNYTSTIEGFGSGQYNITKLTNPLTVAFVCDE